jgi:hypothetical protein
MIPYYRAAYVSVFLSILVCHELELGYVTCMLHAQQHRLLLGASVLVGN